MTKTKAVFETVQDQILEDLLSGVYHAGDPVPDRESLRMAFRTNTETIDRAIQGLEARGLICREGEGLAFTRDRDRISLAREDLVQDHFQDFLDRARKLGMDDGEIRRFVLNKGGFHDQARG